MIDYVGRYEFGFFASGTGVEPSSDIMVQLLELFKDKGFITTTVQELQIVPATKTRLQLQLIDKRLEWNLAFESHRVLLRKHNVHGIDIGTPDNFIKEAVDVFSRLLPVIPLMGTRLSYVTKGLLTEMTTEVLEQVNSKLLKLPAFYSEHPPHQWITKNVARSEFNLGEKVETLNIITEINRTQGVFKREDTPKPFDRIEIGFDINTYQKNMAPRFDIKDVGNFLRKAVEVSQQIVTEAGKIIYA